MTKEQLDNMCELFKGGRCPICDDEWEDYGMTPSEARAINRDCCANSYHPTLQDLEEMYRDKGVSNDN